jgi:hypothetical protein
MRTKADREELITIRRKAIGLTRREQKDNRNLRKRLSRKMRRVEKREWKKDL